MFFVKCSITEARFSLGWDFSSFVLLFWLFDLTWCSIHRYTMEGERKGERGIMGWAISGVASLYYDYY